MEDSRKKILVAAHRGGYENDYLDKAPENSISNIANAISKKFEIYESDVRRTKDGVFIVMHDKTIDRTTTGKGEVKKLNFNKLKDFKLKYNNGEISEDIIPKFSDFISLGDKKIIFKFDYKCELGYLNQLIDEIDELGLHEYVILRFYHDKDIINTIKNIDKNKLPKILFRLETIEEYSYLKKELEIEMISINTRSNNKFTDEQKNLIKKANNDNVIIEAHTFHDEKENREFFWKEQLKYPITIFHTKKPILFKEYINK